MIPEEYREFFVASAGAAGALIGLLFVAVSVFPERAREATTRVEFHTRSSSALLVFSNALLVSLAALVPGVSLGWWSIVAATTVLAFAGAATRLAVAEIRRRGAVWDWVWLVLGLMIIAGWELFAGIRLTTAFEPDAMQALSYVVIGNLAYGIARAWQLVGLRNYGLVTSLRIVSGRDATLDGPADDRPPV